MGAGGHAHPDFAYQRGDVEGVPDPTLRLPSGLVGTCEPFPGLRRLKGKRARTAHLSPRSPELSRELRLPKTCSPRSGGVFLFAQAPWGNVSPSHFKESITGGFVCGCVHACEASSNCDRGLRRGKCLRRAKRGSRGSRAAWCERGSRAPGSFRPRWTARPARPSGTGRSTRSGGSRWRRLSPGYACQLPDCSLQGRV